LLELAAAVGTTGLLWLGGFGALRGWWTIGLLLVVLAYVRNMIKPLRSLAKMSMTLARAAASADRIQLTLAAPLVGRTTGLPPNTTPALAHEPHQPVAATSSDRRLEATREQNTVLLSERPARFGTVDLHDVVLDYGRGAVLNRLNLAIHAGTCAALVGPNGAGKSSILALISGLYPPTAGNVLIDGVQAWDLRPDELARHVAVVPQDTFLFAGTILDNIRYARPDASDAAIRRAADAAQVDRFVTDLPNGYETRVGERGVGLSGGQRQRVGIARALLVDAPIVLLDEPTSGLDALAETDVIDALSALITGRTVIMTTHRPALLRLADVIYDVHDGRCTLSTTHRE
jgi:ABC-type multidrug transport system fused ATPase/permease subunit